MDDQNHLDFGGADGNNPVVGFEDAQMADGFAANFTSMRPDLNIVRVTT